MPLMIRHVGAKAYAAALWLYPPAFRREFSSDMAQDFNEATEETWIAGSWSGLLTLWLHISMDVLRTVIVQWGRTGLPVLCLCSMIGAIVTVSVAARMLPTAPLDSPAVAADRDMMALICLVGTVLVVITATIVFTFWFSRPLLQRHRR